MLRLGFLLLVLVLILVFDWYTFSGLNQIFYGNNWFELSYIGLSIFVLLGFYKVFVDFTKKKGDAVRSSSSNLLMGFGFAVVVAKIVFSGLLLFQDLSIMLFGVVSGVLSLFTDITFSIPSRNNYRMAIAAMMASIPFVSMIYGITFGKYKFVIDHIKLKFPDLPKAFHGFRILQISDVHAGSFDSVAQVRRGIDLIKAQKADLIVFTGDLVNSLKDEINPFLDTFSILSAPYGMFSILGNHDYYGMYQVAGKDPVARKVYMEDFNDKHEKIGFKLLNNESTKIEKDGDFIQIIGVENWGAGPFPKKGDLDKALTSVDKDDFSILLSHDPTHWDHHVISHPKHIHLTLSGHTHGMQFGVKIGKFKWSPVKYRYKRWLGLYTEANQHLYVNRGFGFLGWPGRVGMSPEITVLELEVDS